MRKIVFCLVVLIALIATPAFGAGGHDDHSGHNHGPAAVELNQSQIQEKASGFVASLVEKGKLDASWAQMKPQEAKANSGHEWVVTFFNTEIKEPEKQTLYMFLTLSGEYVAANFSGK